MSGIWIAFLSGALMSVQGIFNTEVTKQTSLWVSSAFVQLTALAVCLIAWIWTGGSSLSALWKVEPRYMLLGGVIGAFITVTVIKSMNALGPAKAEMMIVLSQIAVAYLLELFGMFGVEKQSLEWKKVLGLLVMGAGIVLFNRK